MTHYSSNTIYDLPTFKRRDLRFIFFNRYEFILLTKMRTETKTVPSTWYVFNVQRCTHSDFHICALFALLAYIRNRPIFIRKSEAFLSWLAICLIFWWFYLSSVWWLRKYYHVKIRLDEGLKFCSERLWPLCLKPNAMAASVKTKDIKKRVRNISQ